MTDWLNRLKFDPFPPLLAAGDEALTYFVRRDLLQQAVPPSASLRKLEKPQKIIRRQKSEGYWEYPGKGSGYYLLETFKQLRFLVEMFGLDRTDASVNAACEFVLARQSPEGDIRGIMANQLAAYYHGALLGLLIKAGYSSDPRVESGLHWLIQVRQTDGGWVEFPGMAGLTGLPVDERDSLVTDFSRATARFFSPSQPFSILATGMAIRPFCLSAQYRNHPVTLGAAALLKEAFFKKNSYSTYQHPDNWIYFQFPFWWNNLVAAMDSLSLTGLSAEDKNIRSALDWFIENQRPDGLWDISYSAIHKSSPNSKTSDTQLWVSLSIARILKRFVII